MKNYYYSEQLRKELLLPTMEMNFTGKMCVQYNTVWYGCNICFSAFEVRIYKSCHVMPWHKEFLSAPSSHHTPHIAQLALLSLQWPTE